MNMNEMKVIKDKVVYDKIENYVKFAVVNSYGSDKRYHKYLSDYAKAVSIILMYTDYEGGSITFSDVMEFTHTKEWEKIKEDLGYKYEEFVGFVDEEIKYLNAPLREADATMNALRVVANKITEVISAIDVDALKNYDFTNLLNAIDKVNEYNNKPVEENGENSENVEVKE